MQRAGARSTLRVRGWTGWIDVQTFMPGRDLPDAPRAIADVLRQRHLAAGNVRVLRADVGRLGGRDVAVEEAVITRPAGRFHRTTYVARVEGTCVAIDETAPDSEFAAAHHEIAPYLQQVRWVPAHAQ